MDDFDRDEFETLLDNAGDQARTEWQQEFVADLEEKFERDQFWTPTDAQMAWLEQIAGR